MHLSQFLSSEFFRSFIWEWSWLFFLMVTSTNIAVHSFKKLDQVTKLVLLIVVSIEITFVILFITLLFLLAVNRLFEILFFTLILIFFFVVNLLINAKNTDREFAIMAATFIPFVLTTGSIIIGGVPFEAIMTNKGLVFGVQLFFWGGVSAYPFFDLMIISNSYARVAKIFGITIIESDHFISSILKIPEILSTSIQQYLQFFPNYVKQIKGHDLNLVISKTEEGLQLKFNLSDGVTEEKVGIWFGEFVSFIDANLDKFNINVESGISDRDFDILVAELKNEISHLRNSLEIAKLKAHYAESDKEFLKHISLSLLPKNDRQSLTGKDDSGGNEKDKIIDKLKRGKTKKALQLLGKYAEGTDINDEVISITAQYNRLMTERTTGRVSSSEYTTQLNGIESSIIQLLG